MLLVVFRSRFSFDLRVCMSLDMTRVVKVEPRKKKACLTAMVFVNIYHPSGH